MLFPELEPLTDTALLFLRLLIGILFATSGWSHVKDPEARGESIGLSPGFTRTLGVTEIIAGASLGVGIFAQLAALAVMGVMFGAIYKKMFVWNSGFWGEAGGGWFYDLLYLVCAFLIASTGGGNLVFI